MEGQVKRWYAVCVSEDKEGRVYASIEDRVPSIRKPSQYVRKNRYKKLTFTYYETREEAENAVKEAMSA